MTNERTPGSPSRLTREDRHEIVVEIKSEYFLIPRRHVWFLSGGATVFLALTFGGSWVAALQWAQDQLQEVKLAVAQVEERASDRVADVEEQVQRTRELQQAVDGRVQQVEATTSSIHADISELRTTTNQLRSDVNRQIRLQRDLTADSAKVLGAMLKGIGGDAAQQAQFRRDVTRLMHDVERLERRVPAGNPQ